MIVVMDVEKTARGGCCRRSSESGQSRCVERMELEGEKEGGERW